MKLTIAAALIAAIMLSHPAISIAQKTKKAATMNDLVAGIKKRSDAFNKRPIYKKLTVAIIDKTKDSELLQVVFDNITTKMKPDMSDEFEVVMRLNREREAIFMIWILDSEVNNGGFNQYYYNQSKRYKLMTPDMLKLIGAEKHAVLVSKANDVYEANADAIRKYQDGTMEGFSKSYKNNPLDNFDDQYYALSKKIDLEKLMVVFIRKNKKLFADA